MALTARQVVCFRPNTVSVTRTVNGTGQVLRTDEALRPPTRVQMSPARLMHAVFAVGVPLSSFPCCTPPDARAAAINTTLLPAAEHPLGHPRAPVRGRNDRRGPERGRQTTSGARIRSCTVAALAHQSMVRRYY